MNQNLKKVLEYIKDEYAGKAEAGGRHYLNIDIGETGLNLGFEDFLQHYSDREVVVSLKGPLPGMKVRIDGRTFTNYAEYADGFAVTEHIAKKAGLSFKKYIANDSMILNCV